MDYQNVLDSVAANLGLTINSEVYNAFRSVYASKFQQEFQTYTVNNPLLTDIGLRAREFLTESKREEIRREFLKFADNHGFAIQALRPNQSEPVPGFEYLRARYTIAEPSDVKESLTQQVSDTAEADLFNYVPPNAELGEYNSLYLYNKLNQAQRFHNSNVKPLTNIPNVLGFESAFNEQQFQSTYSQLRQVEQSELMQKTLDMLPAIGILAGSNLRTVDPFTEREQFSYMIPGNPQPDRFSRDPNQPLGAAFNNYHGFTPWYDQERKPLERSVPAGPSMNRDQQLVTAFLVGPQIY